MFGFTSRTRKRLLVHPKVQWMLVGRVTLYWASCVATIYAMPILIVKPLLFFYPDANKAALEVLSVFLATMLYVPMIGYDIIRVSNRFVGPMIRLRNSMHRLAIGEEVQPIKFREGDLWQEFADEFNSVSAYVDGLKASQPQAAEEATPAEVSAG